MRKSKYDYIGGNPVEEKRLQRISLMQTCIKAPVILLSLVILMTGCVTNPPTPFEAGLKTLPPKGCQDLRKRGVMLCYNELQQVLDSVQARFTSMTDMEQHGKPEYWESYGEIPSGMFAGDCDTHAMAIRKELDRLNIRSRLVTAMTEIGTHHLVVEVDGWILDNRRPWVESRSNLPYTWLRISSYSHGGPWYKVSNKISG